MVTFKLINKDGEILTYEYYPEGNINSPGIICFNPKTETLISRMYSKDDNNHNYFVKFLSGLNDNNGNPKNEGVVAWA